MNEDISQMSDDEIDAEISRLSGDMGGGKLMSEMTDEELDRAIQEASGGSSYGQMRPADPKKDYGSVTPGVRMDETDFADSEPMTGAEKSGVQIAAASGSDAYEGGGFLNGVGALGYNMGGARAADNWMYKNAQELASGVKKVNGQLKRFDDDDMDESEIDWTLDAMGANGVSGWLRKFLGGWASRNMVGDENLSQQWEREEGYKYKDPREHKRAKLSWAQDIARGVVGQREETKANAQEELKGRQTSTFADVVDDAITQGGYSAPYALPGLNAAPLILSTLARAGELTQDDLRVDKDGNIVIENEGDDMGRAFGKGFKGAAKEVAIERIGGKLGMKALGKVGGYTLGRIPLLRQVGSKVAATPVGVAYSKYMRIMNNFGRMTGVNSLPEEYLEELEDQLLESTMGTDRRDSELAGTTAGSRVMDDMFGKVNPETGEREGGFFGAENQKNLIRSLLVMQALQGGPAKIMDLYNGKYAGVEVRTDQAADTDHGKGVYGPHGVYARDGRNYKVITGIDDQLKDIGVPASELKYYTTEEKIRAYCAWVDNLDEAEVKGVLDDSVKYVNQLLDTVRQNAGSFNLEKADANAPKFTMGDVVDATDRSGQAVKRYVDEASGITIDAREVGDGQLGFAITDGYGHEASARTKEGAEKAAAAMLKKYQVNNHKATVINDARERMAPGANIVTAGSLKEAIEKIEEAYGKSAADNLRNDEEFMRMVNGGNGEAFYEPSIDAMVVPMNSIKTQDDVLRLFTHEGTHGGWARMFNGGSGEESDFVDLMRRSGRWLNDQGKREDSPDFDWNRAVDEYMSYNSERLRGGASPLDRLIGNVRKWWRANMNEDLLLDGHEVVMMMDAMRKKYMAANEGGGGRMYGGRDSADRVDTRQRENLDRFQSAYNKAGEFNRRMGDTRQRAETLALPYKGQPIIVGPDGTAVTMDPQQIQNASKDNNLPFQREMTRKAGAMRQWAEAEAFRRHAQMAQIPYKIVTPQTMGSAFRHDQSDRDPSRTGHTPINPAMNWGATIMSNGAVQPHEGELKDGKSILEAMKNGSRGTGTIKEEVDAELDAIDQANYAKDAALWYEAKKQAGGNIREADAIFRGYRADDGRDAARARANQREEERSASEQMARESAFPEQTAAKPELPEPAPEAKPSAQPEAKSPVAPEEKASPSEKETPAPGGETPVQGVRKAQPNVNRALKAIGDLRAKIGNVSFLNIRRDLINEESGKAIADAIAEYMAAMDAETAAMNADSVPQSEIDRLREVASQKAKSMYNVLVGAKSAKSAKPAAPATPATPAAPAAPAAPDTPAPAPQAKATEEEPETPDAKKPEEQKPEEKKPEQNKEPEKPKSKKLVKPPKRKPAAKKEAKKLVKPPKAEEKKSHEPTTPVKPDGKGKNATEPIVTKEEAEPSQGSTETTADSASQGARFAIPGTDKTASTQNAADEIAGAKKRYDEAVSKYREAVKKASSEKNRTLKRTATEEMAAAEQTMRKAKRSLDEALKSINDRPHTPSKELADEKSRIDAMSEFGKRELDAKKRAQKSWLLKAIDEAIENRGDGGEDLIAERHRLVAENKKLDGKKYAERHVLENEKRIAEINGKIAEHERIVFDVPDDGKFFVYNSPFALRLFKSQVQKRLSPTALKETSIKSAEKPLVQDVRENGIGDAEVAEQAKPKQKTLVKPPKSASAATSKRKAIGNTELQRELKKAISDLVNGVWGQSADAAKSASDKIGELAHRAAESGMFFPKSDTVKKLLDMSDDGKLTPAQRKAVETTLNANSKWVEENRKDSDKGVRWSKSTQATDAEYMDAVKRGDMETAQNLVLDFAGKRGYEYHAYHGTSRADRVGNVFDPKRATSGPMAFFTSDKSIAENYASNKQDTSLAYEDDDIFEYKNQFKSKRGSSEANVYDMWWSLSPADRYAVEEKAKHVKMDGDTGDIIYDENATDGNGGLRYQIQDYRGNVIRALFYNWLESGNLVKDESRFLDVLRLSGVTEALENAGMSSPSYKDPYAKSEKVYDVVIRMRNPFRTADLTQDFTKGLLEWWGKQNHRRYERKSMNADSGDKNSVSVEEFAAKVDEDLAHDNPLYTAWTSIPDAVTAYLRSLGHDGIIDSGNKFKSHSTEHVVYIPFQSTQVKSAEPVTYDNDGNVIPLSKRFDRKNADIRWSTASSYRTLASIMADTAGLSQREQDARNSGTVISNDKSRRNGMRDWREERFVNASLGQKLADLVHDRNGARRVLGDFIRRKIQDYRLDLLRMEEMAGVTDKGQSAYYAFDSAFGKVEQSLADIEENLLNPLMEQIANNRLDEKWDGDSEGKLTKLDALLMSMHGPERNRMIAEATMNSPDGPTLDGSGRTTAEWNDVRARLDAEGFTAKAQAAVGIIQGIMSLNRGLMVSSGLMSQAQADEWERLSPNYVPLRDEDGQDSTFGQMMWKPEERGGGRSYGRRESPQAMGRKTLSDSPVVMALSMLERTVSRAADNEARQKLAEIVKNDARLGHVADETAGTGWQVPMRQIKTPNGFVASVPDVNSVEQKYGNVVAYKEDGVLKYIVLGNDASLDAAGEYNGLPVQTANRVGMAVKKQSLAESGPMVNFFRSLTRMFGILRTSASPTFLLSNGLADNGQAFRNIVSSHGLGVAKDFEKFVPKAMLAARKLSRGKRGLDVTKEMERYAREWADNGGRIGGMNISNFREMEDRAKSKLRKLERRMGHRGTTLKDAAEDAWNWVQDFGENLNAPVEMGTRLAVYAAMRKSGMSIEDAVSYSRDVTVNFNRKGEWTPIINALYAFSNASIQDLHRSGVAAVGRNGASMLFAMSVVGLVSAMLGYGQDDPEDEREGNAQWKNTKEYGKQNSVGFRLGGKTVGIPLRGLARIPYYIGHKAFEVLSGNASIADAAGKSIGFAVDNLIDPIGSAPTLGQTIAPSVIRPGVEIMENVKFSGQQMYRNPMNEQQVRSEMGRSSTGGVYRFIARQLNALTGGNAGARGLVDVQPEKIEALWNWIGGSLSRDVGQVVDTLSDLARFKAPNVRNVPFVSRMVRDLDVNSAKFHEAQARYDAAKKEFDAMETPYEMDRVAEDAPWLYRRNKAWNDELKDLKNMASKLLKEEMRIEDDAEREAVHKLRMKAQYLFIHRMETPPKQDSDGVVYEREARRKTVPFLKRRKREEKRRQKQAGRERNGLLP